MKNEQTKGTLEEKVNELVKTVAGINSPQCRKLVMLAKKAKENHQKLAQSVNTLQESLDYLRVCIKYQMFDLEATRRENQSLRKMLKDKK